MASVGSMMDQESLPTLNRPQTLMGVIITFAVIAFLAVAFRFYARFKLDNGLGRDDAFVLLSMMSVLSGTVATCLCIDNGLGKRMDSLTLAQFEAYEHTFYAANGLYSTSTALIKVSLLFQYLRVYTSGPVRIITYTILALVVLWGVGYGFVAWVPCFPVSLYWDPVAPDHNARCYGFGELKEQPFVATFESQAATNMALDVAIYLIPAVLVWRKQTTSKRQLLAMVGILSLGLVIIVVSLVRLVSIVHSEAGWYPHKDFTYAAPLPVMCSALEVSLAIIASSMPIFWPVIQASIGSIAVTRTVDVEVQELCEPCDYSGEMEGGSVKSGHGSEDALRLRSEDHTFTTVRTQAQGPASKNVSSGGTGVTGVWRSDSRN